MATNEDMMMSEVSSNKEFQILTIPLIKNSIKPEKF